MKKIKPPPMLGLSGNLTMMAAEKILSSDAQEFKVYRELILELLRSILDNQMINKRLKVVLTPEQTTLLEGKLYDQIASVISRTYVEVGDTAKLPDDEALMIIREMLLEFDPNIIDRNRFRRTRIKSIK